MAGNVTTTDEKETYGTCVVLCVTSDADTARGIIKEYVK